MEQRDLPAVAELETICFSVPWSMELLEACLENSLDRIWVLDIEPETGSESESEIAAYCNFRVIAGEGELMRIAVRPELRGRGYARNLMETLVADARDSRTTAVTLEVRASNLSAVSLYKSYGFQIEAVRRDYYTHPVEDALIMWNREI
ncbi:MAG: ribosomal protein S18-alanine N-acetyltransferase [Clostridium sp.]